MTRKSNFIAISATTLMLSLTAFQPAHGARGETIEDFISGFPEAAPNLCRQMSARHGASNLWVGRFAGTAGGRREARRSAHATVCFTQKNTCKRWLNALNYHFTQRQYVSQCTKGFSGRW
ncbi:hypothetical protein [Coralliovum pocilloporae]|uniref:hypothetical protein n=1 Tax=Coralliovum pocilloporae TaxID=3066369 RepID=UPI003306DA79